MWVTLFESGKVRSLYNVVPFPFVWMNVVIYMYLCICLYLYSLDHLFIRAFRLCIVFVLFYSGFPLETEDLIDFLRFLLRYNYYFASYKFCTRNFSATNSSLNQKFFDLIGISLNLAGIFLDWWRHVGRIPFTIAYIKLKCLEVVVVHNGLKLLDLKIEIIKTLRFFVVVLFSFFLQNILLRHVNHFFLNQGLSIDIKKKGKGAGPSNIGQTGI